MTILVYRTGGHVGRSVRQATLVAEIDLEPHEIPFDLAKLAKRNGGDYAEIIYPNVLLEVQPA